MAVFQRIAKVSKFRQIWSYWPEVSIGAAPSWSLRHWRERSDPWDAWTYPWPADRCSAGSGVWKSRRNIKLKCRSKIIFIFWHLVFLKNMGQSRPLFVYFRSFLIPITISIIQIEKSIDRVLGIRTRVRRMVGVDETTELWRHPNALIVT